jgi:hypothetical protein
MGRRGASAAQALPLLSPAQVARQQVVQAYNFVAFGDEAITEVRTGKSCAPR